MADVGARAVHACLCTIKAHTLRIRTCTHGQGLVTLTKYILMSSTSLFVGDLGMAMAAFASHNYKALGDCFVLAGLSRPKPLRGRKLKASTSQPFCGRSQSGNWQGHSSQAHRGRKRRWTSKGKGADHQVIKPKLQQWQQPKLGSKPKPKL